MFMENSDIRVKRGKNQSVVRLKKIMRSSLSMLRVLGASVSESLRASLIIFALAELD